MRHAGLEQLRGAPDAERLGRVSERLLEVRLTRAALLATLVELTAITVAAPCKLNVPAATRANTPARVSSRVCA